MYRYRTSTDNHLKTRIKKKNSFLLKIENKDIVITVV